MNDHQAVFLLTLVGTFGLLVYLFEHFLSFLSDAGYNPGFLILIGLPSDPDNPVPPPPMPLHALFSATKDLPVRTLAKYPVFLATAAILIATTIYASFFRSRRPKPLDPTLWKEFPLQQKIKVSHNTAIYRFRLPHPQDVLGLPIGQHVSLSASINGKDIIRSYTPVSSDDDRGHFDLIIKTYEKGNISRHVDSLRVGDSVRVKGPKGQFSYSSGISDHLSMIAGGTGITPMLQIIRAVLKNPLDKTTISLIYANVNEDDILLKDELDRLQQHHTIKFQLFYVLNNPPTGWSSGVGFITKDHIQQCFPSPETPNTKLLMCGPPPMMTAIKKHLIDLKYPAPRTVSKLQDQVFVF